MRVAVYIKEQPKTKPGRRDKRYDRIFFLTISVIGTFSMIFAVFPLIEWEVKTLPKLTSTVSFLPVPQKEVLSAKITAQAHVQVVKDSDGFSYFTTDFKPQGPRPKEFHLSIPKMDIEDAIVTVDSLRFEDSLSHFPGSALPGEVGNPFITGHSVLPQFADPKNYHTIFTKLSDLEIGDTITVDIQNKKLTYVVQYSKIVDPHDISVLSPIFPGSRNLTLMSCVPPGTNSKRLVVVTSLL